MSSEVETVSDTLTVGGLRLKMTYGLLSDLQRVVPDPEQAIAQVIADSWTRDYIIRRVLTPIKSNVTSEEELIKAEDIDLTMAEVNEVLDWAVSSILSFFMRQAKGLQVTAALLKIAMVPSVPPEVSSTT